MWGIVEDAAGYLAGDGRHLARANLRRQRLPSHLAEDLSQETLLALHRAELRGSEIDNVEAYTARVMHHIAVDLVRGRVRRRESEVVSLIVDGGAEPALNGDDGADVGVLTEIAVADARRAAARRLHDRPTAAAGALAVLAHADPADPADAADDCPRPVGGAKEAQATAWVGLFYAGLRDCWSHDETDAIRKRRSRYAADQRAVLDQALAAAGLTAGGGRG